MAFTSRTWIRRPGHCRRRSSLRNFGIPATWRCVRAAGFIYAVSEVNEAEGKPGGLVTAFAVDKASGMLKALNKQSSGGAGPAHITVDKTGTHALVANYGGGSVEVLPIAGNGTLEPPRPSSSTRDRASTRRGRRSRILTRSTSLPTTALSMCLTSAPTR